MKRSLPPLNALRAFEAAARLGRMTLAAEELSVTPGAISRQVQGLEATLGMALFEGPKTHPRLTPAGAALLPGLTAALDQMAASVQAIRPEAGGVLDVACLSSFTLRWLIPRLHGFKAIAPAVTVRLTTDSGAVARWQGDVTITVAEADQVQPDDTLLFAEELGPVMAPGLWRSGAEPGEDHWPRLLTRTRPQAWAQWAMTAGLPPQDWRGTEYPHYAHSLQAAEAGLGVVVAPRHLVAEGLDLGRLVAPWGFVDSGLVYFARCRSGVPPPARQFCRWLAGEAAQESVAEIRAEKKAATSAARV